MKLQKQVAFLESHSEYGVCSHIYQILTDETFTKIDIRQHSKNKEIQKSLQFDYIEYGRSDNLHVWYTQPLTLVFRKTLLDNRPKRSVRYYNDVSLAYDFLTTSKGAFALLDAGVYRKHFKGVYSSLSPYEYYIVYQRIYNEIYKRNPNDKDLQKVWLKYSLMASIIHRDFKKIAYYLYELFPIDPNCIPFLTGCIFRKCLKKVLYFKIKIKQI